MLKTPTKASPLFLLCLALEAAPVKPSGLHLREVDFPSPHSDSQTRSTLLLAFVCFSLYPGSSDSCTKDSGILGWDCHPEQAKKQALCHCRQRGWSGRRKGPERASVKGPPLPSITTGSTGNAAAGYRRFWQPRRPLNKQPSLFTNRKRGNPPEALDMKRRTLAPREPAKRV